MKGFAMLFRSAFPIAALFVGALLPGLSWGKSAIDLTPQRKIGDITHVTIELEVGGDLQVRSANDKSGIQDKEEAKQEIQNLPMSVSATLAYDERRLDPPGNDSEDGPPARSLRYYNRATAVIKVDDGGQKPTLPENRRLILVQPVGERTILASPHGPLERAQLDLIDVVGNSLQLESLLPKSPVAEGDTWPQDQATMARLLTLDSIAVCEMESVLAKFNNQYAQIRMAGTVHGTSDGAATELEVRGVYIFNRKQGQITRLNLAIKEKRSLGDATPGFDVVAKLRMKIEPREESAHLTEEVVAALPLAETTSLDTLLHVAKEQGFRLDHDRQWYMTGEDREAVTFRRIDVSGLVAQCTLTRLPPKSADRQTTLEQFEKDVRFSLGKRFGQLVSSDQWTNRHGHSCFRLTVRGQVEKLPVEWHYYLIAPQSPESLQEGHRVSMAVTIEGTMVDQLAKADRALVEALELLPMQNGSTETAAKPVKASVR